MLAAAAQLAIVFAGHVAFPYLRNVLLGPAYGLMLPLVASLHAVHGPARGNAAVLATAAGATHAAIGAAGALNVDLQPYALFALGMWWWTAGKLWASSGLMPRTLGLATAFGALLAFIGSVVVAAGAPMSALVPGLPDLAAWDLSRAALALWLVAVALPLARSR